MIIHIIRKFYAFSIISLICSNIFAQSLEIEEVKFIHKDTKTFDDNSLSDAVAVTKEDVFKSKMLGDDIIKLQKFYFDNGFFDVKVDTLVKYNPEDYKVSINFIIYEKKRYRINSLKYYGLIKLSIDLRTRVDSIKTIKNKDYYNKVLIIQQTNQVVDLLQNNGYMNAGIYTDSGTTVIKYDTSADVLINFTGADTIFKFGKTDIKIDSNVYGVSEDIMRKCITYKEGDIYSKQEKLNTERYMSKYAIVQSARLQPNTFNNEVVDFTARITLNKKNEITPFIEATNIDNYFYLGGGAKYLNKYLFKGGQVFTMELHALFNSPGIFRTELISGFIQPNLFNLKSSLIDKITVGLYGLEGFKNYLIGNLTRVNYYIADKTFYNNATFDLEEEMVWFKYNVDSTQTQFNSFLGATIVHDNTNSNTSPSRGFFHSFAAGEGGLIPSLLIKLFNKNVYYSQFVKFFTSNKFYFDLSKLAPTLVFATKFNIGDIIEFGSGDRIQPVQAIYRFFSGGSNSLRGWNAKRNGILANTFNGGEFQLEGSLELRKKLFPFSKTFTKNIGLAVFFDYGNVWETHKDFMFNQIAMAIGFGPRYDLFLGPVRIDVGFKLYDPSDTHNEKWLFSNFSRVFKDKLAFNFGIGQAF